MIYDKPEPVIFIMMILSCCRGGEEILKYDRVLLNAGDGLNPDTGVFTCPAPGTYMFIIHIATHKDKVIQGYSHR